MKGKLVFVLGAAAGYVLGARAGRKRYEQIKAGADKVWHSPSVQKTVGQVQTFVDDHAPEVQSAVTGGAKKLADKVTNKKTGSKESSFDSASQTPSGTSTPPTAGDQPPSA